MMVSQRLISVNTWVTGKVYAVDAEHREILVETGSGNRAIVQPEHFDETFSASLIGHHVYAEGMRGAGLPLIMRAFVDDLSRADSAGDELFAAPPMAGEG